MKKRVILFSTAVIALAGGLVLLSVTSLADSRTGRLEGNLSYLSTNSKVVVGLDLAGLRSSPLYHDLGLDREETANYPEVRRLLEETGLDPRKDLDTLLFAFDPDAAEGSVVTVATGRFHPDRLTAKLTEAGFRERDGIWQQPQHADLGIAFVNDRTIVVGRHTDVAQSLARKKAGSKGFVLEDRDRAILRGSHAFGVLRTKELFRQVSKNLDGKNVPAAVKSLRAVDSLSFQATATDSIRFSATASCRSQEDAALVADAVRGMLAMAKLSAGEETSTGLQRALDEARITLDGKTIAITLTLPKEVFDECREKLNRLRPGIVKTT